MVIEHIAMYVDDIEGAKCFFVKYFGAVPNEKYHNSKTDFSSYFLSFEGGTRLEIMNKKTVVYSDNSTEKTGYIHIAFSVGSKEKVDILTEKLRQDGFAVSSGPRMTGDGYYESCVVGFENNLIEITV